jgi:hypothetical protein
MHHFTVSKMGCGGCAKSVTRAIHTNHLARAISAAGYPAERA